MSILIRILSWYKNINIHIQLIILLISSLYILMIIIKSSVNRRHIINNILFYPVAAYVILLLAKKYFYLHIPKFIVSANVLQTLGHVSLISFIFAIIIFTYKIITPINTHLRHGPVFKITKKSDGITIGEYSSKILPKHIRKFSQSTGGKITIPYNKLSQTITILGKSGSGKSRLMQLLYIDIKKRYPNIPILIHDPKGEWLERYYNENNDIIFSPYDKRSCSWTLFEDFNKYPYLKHSVAETAIESHHSKNIDRFWKDSATDLLKEAITGGDIEAAREILLNKKEKNIDDKTFMSVFATAKIGFKDIATVELGNQNKKKISLEELINFNGTVFLLNNPVCSSEQHGALTLLLSTFLVQIISLPDVEDENELRAVLFMDEALTFHLPPDIERSISVLSRSKGLCIIPSVQRLPNKQLNEQITWLENSEHIIGMRLSDLETRNFLSQRTGKIRYEEKHEAINTTEDKTSTTESKTQFQHEALASEDFGSLKNREFLLFHENGIAVGKTKEINTPKKKIKNFIYTEQNETMKFMRNF
jgi:hypothetical protein